MQLFTHFNAQIKCTPIFVNTDAYISKAIAAVIVVVLSLVDHVVLLCAMTLAFLNREYTFVSWWADSTNVPL